MQEARFVHSGGKIGQTRSNSSIIVLTGFNHFIKHSTPREMRSNKIRIAQKPPSIPFLEISETCGGIYSRRQKHCSILESTFSLWLTDTPRIDQSVEMGGHVITFHIQENAVRSIEHFDSVARIIDHFALGIEDSGDGCNVIGQRFTAAQGANSFRREGYTH